MKPAQLSNRLPSMGTFDRLFNDFFDQRLSNFFGDEGVSSTPSVNIVEEDKAYRLEVAAPGMDKGDFDINVDDNSLTISAERKHEEKQKDGDRVVRREFQYSRFQRTFQLPEEVDAEHIEAKYDNGVLHISLPKQEDAVKPKRTIEIR